MYGNRLRGIGFDIDGTLYDQEPPVHKLLNGVFNANYSSENPFFTSYWTQDLKAPEMHRRMIEDKFQGEWLLELMSGISSETLHNLNLVSRLRPGFVLTCRGKKNDRVWNGTVDFFKGTVPQLSGVVHCNHMEKWRQVIGLGLATIVEDSLEEATKVVEKTDAIVILVEHGYNVHAPRERIMPVTSIDDAFFLLWELWKKGVV